MGRTFPTSVPAPVLLESLKITGRVRPALLIHRVQALLVTELFRDWATPLAGPAREVIYWYFREVPQLTAAVGVAEAEKRAAQAQGAH